MLNLAGEFASLARTWIIKSFYACVRSIAVSVKVDADKNEVAIAVGDRCALVQCHILV